MAGSDGPSGRAPRLAVGRPRASCCSSPRCCGWSGSGTRTSSSSTRPTTSRTRTRSRTSATRGRGRPTPTLSFNAGHPEIYLDAPSFVAHPPIGKWIIALGLALFGAGDPFGWRIAVAVSGILLVLVTMLIAQRLFRSTLLAVIAGGLLAIDGNAIVHEPGRAARHDARAVRAARGRAPCCSTAPGTSGGSPLWAGRRRRREITLGSGALVAAVAARRRASRSGSRAASSGAGCTSWRSSRSTRWCSEILLRRRAGIPFWLAGTILRQGPITFLLTVPVARARVRRELGGLVRDRRRLLPALGRGRRRRRLGGRARLGAAGLPELVALPGVDVRLPRRRAHPARVPGEPARLALPGAADEHVLARGRQQRRDDPRTGQPADLVGGDGRDPVPRCSGWCSGLVLRRA